MLVSRWFSFKVYSQVDRAFVLKFDYGDSVVIQSSLKDRNNNLNLLSHIKNVLAWSDFVYVLTKGLFLVGELESVDPIESMKEACFYL